MKYKLLISETFLMKRVINIVGVLPIMLPIEP